MESIRAKLNSLSSNQQIIKFKRWSATFSVVTSFAYFLMERHYPAKIFKTTASRDSYYSFERPRLNHRYNNGGNSDGCDYDDYLDDRNLIEKEQEIEIEIKPRATKLPKIQSFVTRYNLISYIWCCLNLFKYLIASLIPVIDSTELRGQIDCLLPGRMIVAAGAIDARNYLGLSLCLFHLTWQSTMLIAKPEYRFESIEFVMCDDDEVIAKEINVDNKPMINNNNQRNSSSGDFKLQMAGSWDPASKITKHYDSIFYFRNSMDRKNDQFILKPNRTMYSWTVLTWISIIFHLVVFTMLAIFLLFIIYMTMLLSLTRRGFELNYPFCVDWLRQKMANRSMSISFSDAQFDFTEFIYKPTEKLEKNYTNFSKLDNDQTPLRIFIPFENIIDINYYHILELTISFLDNIMILQFSLIASLSNTYLSIMMIADMFLYARIINSKLRRIVSEIESSGEQVKLARGGQRDLERRISLIQTEIKDYCDQIRRYNPFSQWYALFCITIWWIFTAVSSFYVIYPNIQVEEVQSDKLIWYVLHAFATALLMLILGTMALISTSGRRIYPSISRLMALDGNSTKRRWPHILNLYKPTPLHCFTIFKSSELSWLFCLKVSSFFL